MFVLGAELSEESFSFFVKHRDLLCDFEAVNESIKDVCGLNNFFAFQSEADEILAEIEIRNSTVSEPNRREYGDFQTNKKLALKIASYLHGKNPNIEFVLEPTCGKGAFIISSLQLFKNLKKIVGVEIYKPYVWSTKFEILHYYLVNGNQNKPEIEILHANAFEYDYKHLAQTTRNYITLVVGNPPWVTNSELGSIESKNLPVKTNFKKHKGLDALTGKGNFDIGEYISFTMLECFHKHDGLFSFLIKNSVVKNIVYDQKANKFNIGYLEKLNIDSKKEFDVSVNACLFTSELNHQPELFCKEANFYTHEIITTFGWYKDEFVYSVDDYDEASDIEGKSLLIWRSGVKHDCSKVMELDCKDGKYTNSYGQEVKLENNLVYGLLKSSDLKGNEVNSSRKSTIITQKKIGQDTQYIQKQYPLTYEYLNSYGELFDQRKSSIYTDKPRFSIFGIGTYSFAPYKVAISGLYKTTTFTLVSPFEDKAIMLDDTCYFIGFEKREHALIAQYLLNSELVQKFLKSIIFPDSKRSINKDTLMRINIANAFLKTNFDEVKAKLKIIEYSHWEEFAEMINQHTSRQMSLF